MFNFCDRHIQTAKSLKVIFYEKSQFSLTYFSLLGGQNIYFKRAYPKSRTQEQRFWQDPRPNTKDPSPRWDERTETGDAKDEI